MNELQIFSNPEFGEVRAIEVNGESWFVGKDVAETLGYGNSRKALSDHVDDEDKGVTKCYTLGGIQEITVINESGLYSLILSSKLPSAKRFKRWITSEVLPSIRKNGGYISGQKEMSEAELMAKAWEVAQRINAAREQRIAALEVENQRLLPKAEYFDELVDRNTLTSFTDTAKALGIKRKVFINYLIDHGYIYRDKKGHLTPRANQKSEGLFELKQCYDEKTGWAGTQALITPKGVETFRLLCAGL